MMFGIDRDIRPDPKSQALQAEIDTQRRLREASLYRAGDQYTESSDHWHGIAPAGVLVKQETRR